MLLELYGPSFIGQGNQRFVFWGCSICCFRIAILHLRSDASVPCCFSWCVGHSGFWIYLPLVRREWKNGSSYNCTPFPASEGSRFLRPWKKSSDFLPLGDSESCTKSDRQRSSGSSSKVGNLLNLLGRYNPYIAPKVFLF